MLLNNILRLHTRYHLLPKVTRHIYDILYLSHNFFNHFIFIQGFKNFLYITFVTCITHKSTSHFSRSVIYYDVFIYILDIVIISSLPFPTEVHLLIICHRFPFILYIDFQDIYRNSLSMTYSIHKLFIRICSGLHK